MTKRVLTAIDIFLDAINSGTLAKGTCTACAVGNLVSKGLGGQVSTYESDGDLGFVCTVSNDCWQYLFVTANSEQKIWIDDLKNPAVQRNIKATEFNWEELAQIEYAFEMSTAIDFLNYSDFTKAQIRAAQIKGIEAVIKVMMTFDDIQGVDVKEVFSNKLELV